MHGSCLELIGITLMIFAYERTLVSFCKKIGTVFFILTCSIMTMFQNEKISLNFQQILTFDSPE